MNQKVRLVSFDEKRKEFTPYGITCELWSPKIVNIMDRHNEIELNYLTKGSITYIIKGEKITIQSGMLSLFWGLNPHRILHFENVESYYVCTIPLSIFLKWDLPQSFVSSILQGNIFIDKNNKFSLYDTFLFSNWIIDLYKNKVYLVLLEMQSRIIRLAENAVMYLQSNGCLLQNNDIKLVDKIAIYIAKNFSNPIRIKDIGDEFSINPDYANSIFKKTFGYTLSHFLVTERISHAQQKLISSDLNISQIAFDCGFNSLNRFNCAFLKITGCTPKEYRRNFKE